MHFTVRLRFIFYLTTLAIFISCNKKKSLFEAVSSDHTGVHFNNRIIETDSLNVLDVSNIYNGGGVGIGDFNRDGLQDIYFTGNEVSNKLYLNKGDFKFEDITEASGTGGNGEWSRGVSVVDINNDGWPDIYVSTTILNNPLKRRNLLYINQGIDKNGVPRFKEMAEEYGLADTSYSTMAAFFDYDNDGDLDMYLVVNEIVNPALPNVFHAIAKNGSFPSSGKLYRNDWNDKLKHPVFKDVSKLAGVGIEGYGHGVNICDINKDGWKDIYVSNDYLPNDLLLINNHDGTFTDHLADYFKHTSSNAMGLDISDINNDGLEDVIVLDMNPEDNYRKKMMLNASSYQTYQNSDLFGYNYQYVRNTLQLNRGPRVNQQDSIGNVIFSDIAFHAGMAETDWSWTPLVTDFDDDGYRDIIITNGFPKDVTDHDFVTFRNQSSSLVSKKDLLKQIPEVKLHNYAYRNNGDLTFRDVSKEWGFTTATFSNGAAYADLDNDGAMDIIINNINDEAGIYRNTSHDKNKTSNHYLQITFTGDSMNRSGLGAWVELHYHHGMTQVFENTPYRGYLSTDQDIAHFGLGGINVVDSVLVKWPGGKSQLLLDVKADQVLNLNIRKANLSYTYDRKQIAAKALFKEITDSAAVHYRHQERDFIDFNIQKLLPHKFSEYGPALAVGDINGDGLDDLIVGGSPFHIAQLFLQKSNGKFIQKPLADEKDTASKRSHDMGILLFDADGDGDLDLMITSGGYESEPNTAPYQDRLYVNDGKGNYTLDPSALPQNFTSKFCIRAADYDRDGDLDLFISGRVEPGKYPKPVSSFIYRNDSKNGKVHFTDVTKTVAKDLLHIGLVCDANWTDFDNDGWTDLILAGEWMPVTFLKNVNGIFENVTRKAGLDDSLGWWNSISSGDFDNDGDMDYVVGNLGTNSYFRGGKEYPVRVYAKDFDKNGIYDMIPSLYLPDQDGNKKEFPAQGRDDLLKQVNAFRKKFPSYKSYAVATMDQVLTEDDRKGAIILEANDFRTALLRNDGAGKFTLIPLPPEAQLSVVNGIVTDDFDGDGNLDLVLNGNDYGAEVSVGRYDALNGLFLKGDGKDHFHALTILQSGIFIPGNGKALVKLKSADGQYLLAASQNRGAMKIFKLKKNAKVLDLEPLDVKAIVEHKNGKKSVQEFYYGSSYLSQSGRFLLLDEDVNFVDIENSKGLVRRVNL